MTINRGKSSPEFSDSAIFNDCPTAAQKKLQAFASILETPIACLAKKKFFLFALNDTLGTAAACKLLALAKDSKTLGLTLATSSALVVRIASTFLLPVLELVTLPVSIPLGFYFYNRIYDKEENLAETLIHNIEMWEL